jgi:hypothetical protein
MQKAFFNYNSFTSLQIIRDRDKDQHNKFKPLLERL